MYSKPHSMYSKPLSCKPYSIIVTLISCTVSLIPCKISLPRRRYSISLVPCKVTLISRGVSPIPLVRIPVVVACSQSHKQCLVPTPRPPTMAPSHPVMLSKITAPQLNVSLLNIALRQRLPHHGHTTKELGRLYHSIQETFLMGPSYT